MYLVFNFLWFAKNSNHSLRIVCHQVQCISFNIVISFYFRECVGIIIIGKRSLKLNNPFAKTCLKVSCQSTFI